MTTLKSGKNKSVAAKENRRIFVDKNRLLLKAFPDFLWGQTLKPPQSSTVPSFLYNQTEVST